MTPALLPSGLLLLVSATLFILTRLERRKMQRLLADHNQRLNKFRLVRGGRLP